MSLMANLFYKIFILCEAINTIVTVTRTCVTSTIEVFRLNYLFSCPKTPRKHVNVVITIFDGESKCCFNEGLLKLKDFLLSFFSCLFTMFSSEKSTQNHQRYHFPIRLTHKNNIQCIWIDDSIEGMKKKTKFIFCWVIKCIEMLRGWFFCTLKFVAVWFCVVRWSNDRLSCKQRLVMELWNL